MGDATPDPVYNLETAPNSFPSWQFIPPNSGPLPPNTKVITTNHTADTPMPETDIVTWLRSILHNDRSVELHCQQAANEIERLRKELVSITYRLTAERDEARRTLCLVEAAILSFGPNGVPYHQSVAHKIAEDYGWDCFKDDTDA